MSSAALYPNAHHSNPLSSPPLASSNGRQQYTSSHSSPTQEAYNGNSVNSTATSRQPPSRSTSDHTQQNQSHNNHNTISNFNANRVASLTASPQNSQVPTFERVAMPPTAPPRSSSNQQSGSSRRAYSGERSAESPRRGPADNAKTAHHGETNGYSDSSRSNKRGGSSHGGVDSTAARTRSRDGHGAGTPVAHNSPLANTREAHEHLSRAVSNPDTGSLAAHGSITERSTDKIRAMLPSRRW